MLSFISANFIDSPNCSRKLIFEQELSKDILNVYIDDAKLTDGMRIQLSLNLAIFCKKFRANGEFCWAICDARVVLRCKKKTESIAQPVAKLVPKELQVHEKPENKRGFKAQLQLEREKKYKLDKSVVYK